MEGVRTRCFYAEYLFLPTHTGHMKHMKHMKCKSRFFGKTAFFLKEFWNCNCEMRFQLLVVLLLFRERGIIVCGRWDALR